MNLSIFLILQKAKQKYEAIVSGLSDSETALTNAQSELTTSKTALTKAQTELTNSQTALRDLENQLKLALSQGNKKVCCIPFRFILINPILLKLHG